MKNQKHLRKKRKEKKRNESLGIYNIQTNLIFILIMLYKKKKNKLKKKSRKIKTQKLKVYPSPIHGIDFKHPAITDAL